MNARFIVVIAFVPVVLACNKAPRPTEGADGAASSVERDAGATAASVQATPSAAASASASPETERLWSAVVAAGDDLVVKNFFIERLSGLPNSGRITIAMAQAKAASAVAAKKYCATNKTFVASASIDEFDRRATAHCQDQAPVSHDLPSGPVVLTKQCTTAYATPCP